MHKKNVSAAKATISLYIMHSYSVHSFFDFFLMKSVQALTDPGEGHTTVTVTKNNRH